MHCKLYDYLLKFNILNNRQYGFRKNHSTTYAVLDLINNITQSFETKEFLLSLFIDLSKAFDVINHTILINKLKAYGISPVNL